MSSTFMTHPLWETLSRLTWLKNKTKWASSTAVSTSASVFLAHKIFFPFMRSSTLAPKWKGKKKIELKANLSILQGIIVWIGSHKTIKWIPVLSNLIFLRCGCRTILYKSVGTIGFCMENQITLTIPQKNKIIDREFITSDALNIP